MSSTIDHNNMSHYQRQRQRQSHDRHTNRRFFHRSVLVWVLLGLLLATGVPAAFYVFTQASPGASTRSSSSASTANLSASPADRFILSIVTQDGALGWHQLCPSIQAQLPLDTLKQQADAESQAMAQHGVWLTAKPMGTRPQADGGVAHLYLVTAHSHNGATQSRKFTVFTQRSGCVEDVSS